MPNHKTKILSPIILQKRTNLNFFVLIHNSLTYYIPLFQIYDLYPHKHERHTKRHKTMHAQ